MITKSTVRWYLRQGFKEFGHYKAVKKLLATFGENKKYPINLVVEKLLALTSLEEGECAVTDQCTIGDFIYALELTYSSVTACLRLPDVLLSDYCEMLCLGLYDGENQSTEAHGYQSYLDAKAKFTKTGMSKK